MKVLITGGHITPAISLIEKLLSHHHQPHLISSHYISEVGKTLSVDQSIAQNYDIPYHQIAPCKYHRHKSIFSLIFTLPKCFKGIVKSKRIISKTKPDIIVSFGGYLSLPVCIAGFLSKVPIVIHEQTTTAGLANRLVSKMATKVAISYKSSSPFFPSSKTILTGNLIRKEFIKKSIKTPSWHDPTIKLPVIYITGGNQGSMAINQTIFSSLDKLNANHIVVHQIGRSQKYNYKNLASKAKQKLPSDSKNRYIFKPWFSAAEVAWLMKNSLLVVSRSGANTISEIIATKAVSLLIPLPTAAYDEQMANAQLIKDHHGGLVLNQDQLDPKILLTNITTLKKDLSDYKKGMTKLNSITKKDGTSSFYKLIGESVKS